MARSAAANSILDELGALIRAQREKARITGPELARRAGFSQSKLSKIENGKLWPSTDDVRCLASETRMDAATIEQALQLLDQLQEAVQPAGSPKARVPLAQRDPDAQRDLDELGALIRQHRMNAKISGVEVARRTGFSQSKLSKIENGNVRTSMKDVRRLASEIGMTPDATGHAVALTCRLEAAARRRQDHARRVRQVVRRRTPY